VIDRPPVYSWSTTCTV